MSLIAFLVKTSSESIIYWTSPIEFTVKQRFRSVLLLLSLSSAMHKNVEVKIFDAENASFDLPKQRKGISKLIPNFALE